MHKTIPVFLFFLLFSLVAGTAMAEQTPMGKVQTLTGTAIAAADGTKRELAKSDDVFASETVATAKDSFLQIMFADGTVLALEADSMVELKEFAYEVGNADQSRISMNMISGSLRFLSGQVARFHPEGFEVETPLGTIGIRGTEGLATANNADPQGYSDSLNQAIGAPGPGWSPPAAPKVTKQTVAHINGSANKAMTFSDFNNRTVSLARGQAVDVSGETGAGDPRGISPQDRQQMKNVDFAKNAPTPAAYKNAFSGYAGGGRPSATAVGDPSGSGSNSEPAATGTSESSSGHNH